MTKPSVHNAMTRRYVEIPFQLLDIEGDGFHIMIQGKINGQKANFIIDTGASRSVFDPNDIGTYIGNLQLEKKQGVTAGVGSSDLESSTFTIDRLSIGKLDIENYLAVALDLDNIHETYGSLNLPKINGIIGGDVLARYKAVINYKLKKIRLTPDKLP